MARSQHMKPIVFHTQEGKGKSKWDSLPRNFNLEF